MGDVAMTSPVIAELLNSYPDVRVVMLTRSFYEPFFTTSDRFEIYNLDLLNRHRGVKGIYRLFRELKSKYTIDEVADLHSKLYSRLLCLFFKLSGTKCHEIDKGRKDKKALTRPRNKVFKQLCTSVKRYVDVMEKLGMPLTMDNALRKVERTMPSQFGKKDGRWIGISPFAQHCGKMLPIETIEQVISTITDRIFIFGGGDYEQKIAGELEAKFEHVTSVVGKIKLKEEMDLIANLDVMLSMDSSAMHISSLMGVRVVSVWGATHPYAGFLGMGQSKQDVIQIDDLVCRPCSVYGHKPCARGDYACLNRITPEMITAILRRQ